MSTESKTALYICMWTFTAIFFAVGIYIEGKYYSDNYLKPQIIVKQSPARLTMKSDGTLLYVLNGIVQPSPFTKDGFYLLTDHGIEYQGESKLDTKIIEEYLNNVSR